MTPPVHSLLVVTAPIKKESDDQRQVRKRLLRSAQDRGWNVLPFIRAITIGYIGKAAGRKVDVLSPQDARDMYREAHQSSLAVLATASFRVRPDPSSDPATDRALWLAEDFLLHKAHVSQVRAIGHVDAALDTAEFKLAALCCEGATDPRVLPMHMFDPRGIGHDLSSIDGRRAFQTRHGAPSSRTDPGGRAWRTGALHGREILYVARFALPAGFHWDVMNGQGKRHCRIVNGWQVWELTSRKGYANIAPNANIRRGNNECVRRWP
jgi:hypothetical protein